MCPFSISGQLVEEVREVGVLRLDLLRAAGSRRTMPPSSISKRLPDRLDRGLALHRPCRGRGSSVPPQAGQRP